MPLKLIMTNGRTTQEAKQSLTPIHIKWENGPFNPKETISYVLARNGLFLIRNHAFFQSSVLIRDPSQFPVDLADQDSFFQMNFPNIPKILMELIVGYFDKIWKKHSSEAMVLIGFDRVRNEVVPIIPDQIGIVLVNALGKCLPIGLDYVVPAALPESIVLFADIHCHGSGLAYSSSTDNRDNRTGLHIVVGRIDREPPDFFCQACVDRHRFVIPQRDIIFDYCQRRLDVPEEWLNKVVIDRTTQSI